MFLRVSRTGNKWSSLKTRYKLNIRYVYAPTSG